MNLQKPHAHEGRKCAICDACSYVWIATDFSEIRNSFGGASVSAETQLRQSCQMLIGRRSRYFPTMAIRSTRIGIKEAIARPPLTWIPLPPLFTCAENKREDC